MQNLNLDNKSVRVLTSKLEKLHRSALPVAARGTINSAAFDVKQKTMPASAKSAFVERRANFFKANSKVDMAKGFNMKTMKATVGFIDAKLSGSDNHAVKDLVQQEYGGTIKGRSFIPTDAARGGSSTKPVRPGNRLQRIRKLANAQKISGSNNKQRFIKAVFEVGRGGFVLAELNGKKYLWKVNSLNQKTGKYKLTMLYTFENNRSVKVKQTSFMREATLKSANRMARFFDKEAKRQIKRLTNR